MPSLPLSIHPPMYRPPYPLPPNPPSQYARPPLDLTRLSPAHHQAAYEYDNFLSSLVCNSKDVINSLSKIAGENIPSAAAIVSVLEQRLSHAAPSQKLPFLYLLDSIVKNIGQPYIDHFASNLYHTYYQAYTGVEGAVREIGERGLAQTRHNMHRLLNTWPDVFGHDLVASLRSAIAQHEAHRHSLNVQTYPQNIPYAAAYPQNHSFPVAHSHPPQPLHNPPPPQPYSMPPPLRSQPPPPPPQQPPLLSHPAPMPPFSPPFLDAQRRMAELNAQSVRGLPVSSHQLFTMNSLLTAQLSKNPPHHERERLLQFQADLRTLSARSRSAQRQQVTNPPPSVPQPVQPAAPPPINPPPIPMNVSSALANLLKAAPQGLMRRAGIATNNTRPPMAIPSTTTHHASQLPPAAAPMRSMPMSRAVPRSVMSQSAPSLPVTPAIPPPPTALQWDDLKTVSTASAVRALYADLSHLSRSDGMRFRTMGELRVHLDWLFQNNRRKRRTPGVVIGRLSRGWYEREDDYFGDKENPQVEEKKQQEANKEEVATEAKGEDERCAACTEPFESYWDDSKNSWMLKGAERVENGDVFHAKCLESILMDEQRKEEERLKAAEEEAIAKVEQPQTEVAVSKVEAEPVKEQPNASAAVKDEPAEVENKEPVANVTQSRAADSAEDAPITTDNPANDAEVQREKQPEASIADGDQRKRKREPDVSDDQSDSPEKKMKLEASTEISQQSTLAESEASPTSEAHINGFVNTDGKRQAWDSRESTPVKRQKLVT